jgi:hypothetical protein
VQNFPPRIAETITTELAPCCQFSDADKVPIANRSLQDIHSVARLFG